MTVMAEGHPPSHEQEGSLFVQEIADQVRNDGIGYGSCQLNNSQLNNSQLNN